MGLERAAFENADFPVEGADPYKIVNEYCCRPVLPKDIDFMKESFLRNGYIESNLLSSRYATAPEIEAFYMRHHKYSAEKATEVAKTYMKQGKSGGHFYTYDGHIRKFVSRQLLEIGILPPGFRLRTAVVPPLSEEDEIAFSLSRNAVNEFCVSLSFLATLVRCHQYDEAVTCARKRKNLKPLAASGVARNMVSSASGKVVDEKALEKMTETKRHVIGIARKLPAPAFSYFIELLSSDSEGLQVAFTMANMKAVPKKLQPEECVSLLKRMVKYYETCLPTPKAIQSRDLQGQVVNMKRAANEIEKFKRLCECDDVPHELGTLADRMLSTQLLDEDLSANCLSDDLFPQLVSACPKSVAGGTQHLARAERKLRGNNVAEDGEHMDKDVPSGEPPGDLPPGSSHQDFETCGAPKSPLPHSTLITDKLSSEQKEEKSANGEDDGGIGIGSEDVSVRHMPRKRSLRLQNAVRSAMSSDTEMDSLDVLAKKWLPAGWNLVNSTFETFAREHESWKVVQGKADLVVTELPKDEQNEDWIKELVVHSGMAMKLTGVCHMFCTHLQFGKVHAAASQEGMEMMPFPMLYLWDCSKIKKRTLSQHPQENGRVAAVFWRSPTKSIKHHFCSSNTYPESLTPGWTNCVTNVPPPSALTAEDGIPLRIQVLNKALMSFILEQWCQPAGLCYNPRSEGMTAGLACHDRGVQYIALEEDEQFYDAASRRVIQKIRCEVNKRPKTCQSNSLPKETKDADDSFCSIGSALCKMPGQAPTYKCKGCKKPMHDVCDWAKVVKKMPLCDRELVSVCSEVCYSVEMN